jgi:hypothetical protein
MEKTGHVDSTLPPVVRHDRVMDQHALGRLGHHIVSRRVALGYRNRTDLANSLQFTVRTLSDIENGVRKASPGTYAMLETSSAGRPEVSTPSWPAENPKSWSSTSVATAPNLDTTPSPVTLCPAPPPRSCCWSCAIASSGPASDAAKPGTTGTAWTHAVTGPTRASQYTDNRGQAPVVGRPKHWTRIASEAFQGLG